MLPASTASSGDATPPATDNRGSGGCDWILGRVVKLAEEKPCGALTRRDGGPGGIFCRMTDFCKLAYAATSRPCNAGKKLTLVLAQGRSKA
jgi:hypothetical protein